MTGIIVYIPTFFEKLYEAGDSRDFIDITVSNNVGIDHCFNPTKRYSKTTKATSVTFGIGKSFGIGYDYYDDPITILKWKVKKRWSLNMRYIIDRTVQFH